MALCGFAERTRPPIRNSRSEALLPHSPSIRRMRTRRSSSTTTPRFAFHIYEVKGDPDRNYLYWAWEWEGEMYVREDIAAAMKEQEG